MSASRPNPREPYTGPVLVRAPQQTGLHFSVAGKLDEVERAWSLVYKVYRQRGLVVPNPYRLHLEPGVVTPRSAVVIGNIGQVAVSTLTATAGLSSDDPLPIDRLFPDELAKLRGEGRVPVELGLFADRRQQLARSADALFHLAHQAFYFARTVNAHDILITVDPRHAEFYTQWFGFQPLGLPRPHTDHPSLTVTLMRCDIERVSQASPPPPAVAYFLDNPVEGSSFLARFDFSPDKLTGSAIADYLASLNAADGLSAAG
ncbi:MAG: hypothetical protein GC164_05610 [Phycisphaera sp.]|nr:hypothetical protein [Phycisphaera sp.]